MGNKRLGRCIGLAATAIGCWFVPAAAQAANPACGSTIKHDVKLTSDLDCSGSPTNGLIVGKNGVTINLNGHSLIGPGTGDGDGIDDTDGYDHFTLENGTVRGYEENIYIEYSTGSRVLHVHGGSSDPNDYYGIDIEYSVNPVISHSTASSGYTSGDAFYLYDNTNENVNNSKATNFTDTGVFDESSTGKVVNLQANGGDYGFYIEDPLAQGYLIKDSTANGNGTDGFYIYGNYPTTLDQATLVDNVANNNGSYGYYADVLTKGSGNKAKGNGTTNCFHVPCSH